MRMICFGDSNTYGYDPRGSFGGRYEETARWPELLAALTGWEVCNLGANGREIPRNPYALRDLAKYAPVDRFLVMLGTNDLLQGVSAAEAGARMESFLREMIAHCAGVLLVCPPPMKRGAWVSGEELIRESVCLGAVYAALARKLGIPFVDTRSWNIGLAFDGVHFTEAGHRAFAEKLEKELRP